MVSKQFVDSIINIEMLCSLNVTYVSFMDITHMDFCFLLFHCLRKFFLMNFQQFFSSLIFFYSRWNLFVFVDKLDLMDIYVSGLLFLDRSEFIDLIHAGVFSWFILMFYFEFYLISFESNFLNEKYLFLNGKFCESLLFTNSE